MNTITNLCLRVGTKTLAALLLFHAVLHAAYYPMRFYRFAMP